jgi:RNA polymerase sigma-70 factor (ECF subfamily)
MSTSKLSDLVKRALEGNKEAAEEVFTVYGSHILCAVRRSMHPRLRTLFDSSDFAQDVWASFFADSPDQHNFDSPEQLIAFLSSMARYKVIDAARSRLGRDKGNVPHEVSLEEVSEDHFPEVQETPSAHLKAQEEWIAFLRRQPAVYRRIFIMYREGRSAAEIAEELQLNERTVRRVLRKIIVGGLR